jgi:two-component system response regulator GlrR
MITTLERLPKDEQPIGVSDAFKKEIEKIPRIATSDASVFIFGETGTGKELCAKAIHRLSPRSGGPFVPVNSGAIPTNLLENELFGHGAGAFTDAFREQVGLIQEAQGGTIFLDEILSLPPRGQVKLLRFLQNKEWRPLGTAKTFRADVRVIAASNVEPEQAVRKGLLNRNLYYRLHVVPIHLPPLRQRREDIPLLARYFVDRYSNQMQKNIEQISPEAMEILVLYDWPGNIRELEHVVQRAIVVCEQAVIETSHILLPRLDVIMEHEPFKDAKERAVAEFEREYIERLLTSYHGNISHAAKAARKNRRAFWELMRKHGIDAERFKYSCLWWLGQLVVQGWTILSCLQSLNT